MTVRAHDPAAVDEKHSRHAADVGAGPPGAKPVAEGNPHPSPQHARGNQLEPSSAPQAAGLVHTRGRVADGVDVVEPGRLEEGAGDLARLEVRNHEP